jgi:peptidyl-tRNA hydrolase
MDSETLINCLKMLPPSQSVLIRGDHGIGKSQIVRELAISVGKPLIDVRASTMQEGDAVGYPDLDKIKELGVTCFALPSWYIAACKEGCILFLDELNRGLIGVMNGMFQIVLDRELGSDADGKPIRLHPDTQVIAAVNSGHNYTVNEIDPALLSRFWTVDYKPSVSSWVSWAKSNNINPLIIEFIEKNPAHLRTDKDVEPGKKTPDQRAWHKFDIALCHNKINLTEHGGSPPAMLYHLALGFFGVEAAMAIVDFVKNYDSVLQAEDVLNKWSKLKDRVVSLDAEKHLALIQKISTFFESKNLSAKQISNLHKYFQILSGELKMLLYGSIIKTKNTKNIEKFHPFVASEIVSKIDAARKLSK